MYVMNHSFYIFTIPPITPSTIISFWVISSGFSFFNLPSWLDVTSTMCIFPWPSFSCHCDSMWCSDTITLARPWEYLPSSSCYSAHAPEWLKEQYIISLLIVTCPTPYCPSFTLYNALKQLFCQIPFPTYFLSLPPLTSVPKDLLPLFLLPFVTTSQSP